MDCVLLPNEIEMFIDTLAPQSMKTLGTQRWLELHERIQKLNQEAVVEAMTLKEEHVKEALITLSKVTVLIHEAILVNIWKYKVLPYLLKLEPNPENTFIAYSILYHEGVCVSLLETVMYHASCCEALEDAALDLLDYVTGTISQLLTINSSLYLGSKEDAKKELFRQRSDLCFDIGIRSLTIIRYLAENMDRLPIGVYSRMYGTNDVPVLLTEILLVHPWSKDGKLYASGKWKNCENTEKVGQVEAQVWLTIRHLVLDPEVTRYYPITKNRKMQLMKLLPLMTPTLLDQLSPLMEVKHLLCRVSCMEEQESAPSKPVLLESVLEIKESILQQCKGGSWKKLAEKQVDTIFTSDKETLQNVAQTLSEAYNTDLMEKIEAHEAETKEACAHCEGGAVQRCSRCKKKWYCSRNCQVAHWPQHKEECLAD